MVPEHVEKENEFYIPLESEMESEEEDSPPPKKFRSLMVDSDDDEEDDKTLNTIITNSSIDQLEAYKNLKTKIPYDQNPLIWWKENETVYPTVSL